jgi:hypothetical protein
MTEAAQPFFYLQFEQAYSTGRATALFVRTAGEPSETVPLLRAQ